MRASWPPDGPSVHPCPYCQALRDEHCCHLLAIERWYGGADQTPALSARDIAWVLSPFSEAEEVRLARLWGALKARADSSASASIRTLAEEVTRMRSMEQAVFDQLLLRELKSITTYEVLVGTRPVMHALVWWRYHFSPRPDRARQRVQRYLARLERQLGIVLEGTPDR